MHDKDGRWVANVKRQQYLYPWEKGWATAPRCRCKWAGAWRRAPWIVLGPELLASSSSSVGESGSGPGPAILNLQSVLVFGKWLLEPFCGSGWQERCSRLGSKVLFYLCIQKSIKEAGREMACELVTIQKQACTRNSCQRGIHRSDAGDRVVQCSYRAHLYHYLIIYSKGG